MKDETNKKPTEVPNQSPKETQTGGYSIMDT